MINAIITISIVRRYNEYEITNKLIGCKDYKTRAAAHKMLQSWEHKKANDNTGLGTWMHRVGYLEALGWVPGSTYKPIRCSL